MTIAQRIKADLKSRIRAGRLPDHLTLTALARQYGVSFTPIRAATGELVAERFLRRQPNGRLVLGKRRPTAAEALAIHPAPGAPEAWEADLLREIVRRSLRGEDGYLREEATAARLCVGRTAIRQAFSRLAGTGFLEHVPRQGWRVRRFSADELRAYLEIRETLELKALELSRRQLQAADLRRMLSGNWPSRGKAPARLDNQLHAYLIEKSGNAYIRDFFAQHGVYYSALFDHAAPEARVVDAMAAQHRAILRALLAKNWSRARAALSRHIRAQRPVIEKLLTQIRSERRHAAARAGYQAANAAQAAPPGRVHRQY